MKEIPLGQSTTYSETYDPALLVPVARQPIREALNIQTQEMLGQDIWNIYEASWLDSTGIPRVACIEMCYPANSPAIVESKSLKLYFNSMNQTRFESLENYLSTIESDLTTTVGSEVNLKVIEHLQSAEDWQAQYQCIDEQNVNIDSYTPSPEILENATNANVTEKQKWVSHLFKTNCMVTGQPDWGSVFIEYEGPQLDTKALLRYLISFRNHQAFHEPSCEMIFDHLLRYCEPLALSVYCRYTRRGGIDINPFRATFDSTPPNLRMLRQ